MKRIVLLFSVAVLATSSQAQGLKNILKKDPSGKPAVDKILKNTTKSSLSNDEIVSGLKEALSV